MVKYRPYFRATQVDELIRCLKISSPDIELLRYLETFRAKISFDAISKTIQTPRATISDRLELSGKMVIIDVGPSKQNCYDRWLAFPEHLTLAELEKAHMHRYENDLMTPEEEADFESRQIGI